MDCSRETLVLQQREWKMGTKLEQIAKLAETDPWGGCENLLKVFPLPRPRIIIPFGHENSS
jgi:hypothetical protein